MRRILSSRYYAKLLSLPQRHFDRELTGTVINRLSRNTSETTQFLNGFANNFLPMLLTTAAVLVVSAWYSWWLALVLLIVFPLYVWLTTLTSALDTRSERQVQAGLDELMAGRTSLIIAHRLSTVHTVDRIETLKDGRIDEVGTPAELARSGGLYAELLALQESGSAADRRRLRQYDLSV